MIHNLTHIFIFLSPPLPTKRERSEKEGTETEILKGEEGRGSNRMKGVREGGRRIRGRTGTHKGLWRKEKKGKREGEHWSQHDGLHSCVEARDQ